MSDISDSYTIEYKNLAHPVLAEIRQETYGEDIGQTGWLTVDEYRQFISWLELDSSSRVLDIACGAGGPALFLGQTVGCQVSGLDINPSAIAAANELTQSLGLDTLVHFQQGDASQRLPFGDQTFTAVICIDAMNHLPGRLQVLHEWHRVLRPGGRALFTDSITVTGILSNEEIALRSYFDYFLFTPPGENVRLIQEAGFALVHTLDMTEKDAALAKRWYDARARRRDDLLKLEGETEFENLQRFWVVAHTLTSERRLSRFAFLAQK
jgi:ubiquinone/menaquinone biosynthesis C-methylase UbiE